RLERFESAHFGIGKPSVGALGRMAAGGNPTGYMNRSPEQLGINLLFRGTFGAGLPFYCAAKFPDVEVRERALARLEGFSVLSAIGEVRVEQVVRHPISPVPQQRFASALSRVRRLGGLDVRGSGDIKLPAPDEITDEEIAAIRVRTAEALAERGSDAVRMAMELDDGYLLAWNSGNDFWDEAIVQGAGFVAQRVTDLEPGAWFNEGYADLRLRQLLGLGPAHGIARYHSSLGNHTRSDPLAREIGYRSSRVQIYNSAQPQLQLPLNKEHLHPLIEAAFVEE